MLGADQKGTESRRQGGGLSHQGGWRGDLSQGQFDFSGQRRAHSLTHSRCRRRITVMPSHVSHVSQYHSDTVILKYYHSDAIT